MTVRGLTYLVKKIVASASVLCGCSASQTYVRSCELVNPGSPDDVI